MPIPWFRRKKKEQAPDQAAAPAAPEITAPARVAGAERPQTESDQQAAKRRRGSRGGRSRRKPTASAAATATAEPQPAQTPERTEPKAKRERKPAGDRKAPQRTRTSSRRRLAPKRAALPPAKRELLVSVDVGEQRVAIVEDGKVAEVYLERPERRSIAGNIYLGVVDNVLPGMEAAFVEMGLEKNGFLYVDEIVGPELEGRRHGKKIQDLLSRGQTILVQAVKDPMKSKGARLTTEISLPGRFVVFVPSGEGLGVSRRLPDDERTRLKEVVKALEVKEGGVIVRTAAEGASAEDVERDLVFLQRLWKSIQARANEAKAPALVYQEAELPLRIVRDLFTGDFEAAHIDNDRAFKRIVGYLKKTSPHMVERVHRYKERAPLLETWGVDAEIRSTLSRRVDLPSGGYLVFDYAEAFTVIDVNTGRFVGSRSKSSGARLEDTITKNNLEAVKEVVRQLRLRDIGGIIVIDFIDMANPRNRATVEEALRSELERDRTKTYVVEISPLGLVEMTRQNVTDGPREILTRKCPTCSGDGIVISETTAAVDAERRLRGLVSPGSRTQAYSVELHPRVLDLLVGPAGSRLAEIEAAARRRFFLQPAENGHALDHFLVLGEGKLEDVKPSAPVAEGDEVELKLVEVGLHDGGSAVGKVEGYDVTVAGTAKLVGRKVRARIERALAHGAYAAWVDAPAKDGIEPISAEREAEKPTRQPPQRRPAATAEAVAAEAVVAAVESLVEVEAEVPAAETGEEAPKPRKRTRRGSRGGRGRKKPVQAAVAAESDGDVAAESDGDGAAQAEAGVAESMPDAAAELVVEPEPELVAEPEEPEPVAEAPAPRIHVPGDELGRDGEAPEEAEGEAEAAPKKKRTRRGSRGGRTRKRKPAAAATAAGENGDRPAEPEAEPPVEPEEQPASDWEYVPMSEWDDDLGRK